MSDQSRFHILRPEDIEMVEDLKVAQGGPDEDYSAHYVTDEAAVDEERKP